MDVFKSGFTAEQMEYALSAVPSIGENGNWWIGDTDTGVFAGGVDVTGAEIGQTIKVAAVDENGRPTAWEAVGFGEKWEKINDITVEEVVDSLTVSVDADGNPFSLKKALIFMHLPTYNYDGITDTGYSAYKINGIGSYQSPSGGWANTDIEWIIEAQGFRALSDMIVHEYSGGWKNRSHYSIKKDGDETFFETIKSITWALFNRKVMVGTKLEIYGVRA